MTIGSRTAENIARRGVGLGLASLLVALAAVGCSGSSTTPSSTPQTRSTPTVVPSETPSGTPTLQLQVDTPAESTPTPSATVEATPFALPPVDNIINPSPSEMPKTATTAPQVKDDIDKLIAVPSSGLNAEQIKQLNALAGYIMDPTTKPDLLDQAGESIVVTAYSYAKNLTNPEATQAAYKTAFDAYWQTIARNPNAKSDLDGFLGAAAK